MDEIVAQPLILIIKFDILGTTTVITLQLIMFEIEQGLPTIKYSTIAIKCLTMRHIVVAEAIIGVQQMLIVTTTESHLLWFLNIREPTIEQLVLSNKIDRWVMGVLVVIAYLVRYHHSYSM